MGLELPDWLREALSWVGCTWPEADETKLRELGDYWTTFSGDAEAHAELAVQAVDTMLAENKSPGLVAFEKYWDKVAGEAAYIPDCRIVANAVGIAFLTASILVLVLKILVIVQLIAFAVILTRRAGGSEAACPVERLGRPGGDLLMDTNKLSQETFDRLLAEHQQWWYVTSTGDGKYPVNFYRKSLRHLDLKGKDLGGLPMIEADLEGCDLTETILSRAGLNCANLRGARLVRADLYKAYLAEADFTGADLTGARLMRADCPRTVFANAILDGTDLNDPFFFQSDFRDAKIRAAKLTAAGFGDCLLQGADFTGSTGTVTRDETVIVDDKNTRVDTATALNAAGARVTDFVPPKREGSI